LCAAGPIFDQFVQALWGQQGAETFRLFGRKLSSTLNDTPQKRFEIRGHKFILKGPRIRFGMMPFRGREARPCFSYG